MNNWPDVFLSSGYCSFEKISAKWDGYMNSPFYLVGNLNLNTKTLEKFTKGLGECVPNPLDLYKRIQWVHKVQALFQSE